jgi:lysophospholipase L1-like esterase
VTRVMRLGDSHTVGLAYWGGMAKSLPEVTWVGSVNSGDGPHEGHEGWSISGIAKNLDAWLDTAQPDIVTLMIGTNDAAGDRDPGAMLEDAKSLVRTMSARNIQVIWSTIPPYPAKASIQSAYNQGVVDAIPGLQREGLRVRLADSDKILASDDLSADRIHLQQPATQKLADLLVQKIREVMSDTGVSVSFMNRLRAIPFWKKAAAGLLVFVGGIYLLSKGSEP